MLSKNLYGVTVSRFTICYLCIRHKILWKIGSYLLNFISYFEANLHILQFVFDQSKFSFPDGLIERPTHHVLE